MMSTSIPLPNPLLNTEEDDKLYHFGLLKSDPSLRSNFGDVKFVCMGGSAARLKLYAELFAKEDGNSPIGENLSKSDRFAMWKTGQVLWVNHGMGVPSLSIMLVELLKLLHYAAATNVHFIRLGTSGGVGVPAGTVIITSGMLNGLLEPYHIQVIGGKVIKREAVLSKSFAQSLLETGLKLGIPTDLGLTLCTDDFYEGQMRLDGIFCEYTPEDKHAFMEELQRKGVKNIEMEGIGFASYMHRAGVEAAVVCVTLLNRMECDQVAVDKATYQEYEQRPFRVVSTYIREKLIQNGL